MYDSPDNKTITIILNQLKDTDKGYYWCMTDEDKEQQSSTELKIIDGTSLRVGSSLPAQQVENNLVSTTKEQIWLFRKRSEVRL